MLMEWIIVGVLVVTICMLSIVLLWMSRIGRVILCLLLFVLLSPFLYLGTEIALLYTIGRSIVPQVGVFCGVFVPPPTYFTPLVSMPLRTGVFAYEGEFRCRHFGRHAVDIEIDKSASFSDMSADVDFDLFYRIIDSTGKTLVSGMAPRGNQGWKTIRWPYVYCARFDVPSQVPRNARVKIVLKADSGLQKFLERTPCTRFVVMKVSDE